MSRIFAIGDIHGCSKTFRKILFDKIRIIKSDRIYCVGDYIDRGKNSKEVVDLILELRKKEYHVYTVRGNHEQMLLKSGENSQFFEHWMINGGDETLRSFGISSIRELDPVYMNFFKNTEYFIETEQCIFVHAGLNFNLPDPFEDKASMLWIRNFTVQKEKLKGKILVHGHTPVPLQFILKQKFEGAVNIDGGCVHHHRDGLGNLIALNINEKKIIAVRNID